MKYPVFTYDDGTEVTASKINVDGTFKLYIEKWDNTRNGFNHLMILLPENQILECEGYDSNEIKSMCEYYDLLKEDIKEYIEEKESESA